MLNDFSHRVIEYRWSTTAKALELIQMHEMKKENSKETIHYVPSRESFPTSFAHHYHTEAPH